jgi:hypothetical protein
MVVNLKLGLITFVATSLSLLGPALAADKVDILGISTGMPYEEVKQLMQAKGWSYDVQAKVYRTKESQEITLQFAPALPNQPLKWMRVQFSTGESDNNVIASLSEQFGQPRTQIACCAFWRLTNGSDLELASDGMARTLDLSSRALHDANEMAAREQAAAKNPMPKF